MQWPPKSRKCSENAAAAKTKHALRAQSYQRTKMLGEEKLLGSRSVHRVERLSESKKILMGAVATEEHKMLQWYCLPHTESQSEKVGASASSEKVRSSNRLVTKQVTTLIP